MGRVKQRQPLQREPSGELLERVKSPLEQVIELSNDAARIPEPDRANGHVKVPNIPYTLPDKQAGVLELVICVGGIYASFLTWALLQERIMTTPYGSEDKPEIFDFSIFLNTIQSTLAALVGYVYLRFSSRGRTTPKVIPTRAILAPLTLVAVTSSLASPFGYASLKHVGYITYILAKSCKLVPVMALHVSLFRRKYPLYKYVVVALVTSGVAVFTLYHPTSSKKAAKQTQESSNWGLFLLGINLLFDGLTNSTQDYINTAYAPYSGSQMMCANNLISTLLTSSFLLLSPYLAGTSLGQHLSIGGSELSSALAFLSRNPAVTKDIFLFAACGAIGQVFIFFTLAQFSSLLLVTITVTRKMLTMLLSVLWFGHRLSGWQWVGVGLVFGGVGAEAAIGRWEKKKKDRRKEGALAGKKN